MFPQKSWKRGSINYNTAKNDVSVIVLDKALDNIGINAKSVMATFNLKIQSTSPEHISSQNHWKWLLKTCGEGSSLVMNIMSGQSNS
jgi:hypothetical protein